MADPELYRAKDEVEAMKAKDPLELFARRIDLTDAERAQINREVETLIQQAATFAEESAPPTEADLWAHVLAEPVGG